MARLLGTFHLNDALFNPNPGDYGSAMNMNPEGHSLSPQPPQPTLFPQQLGIDGQPKMDPLMQIGVDEANKNLAHYQSDINTPVLESPAAYNTTKSVDASGNPSVTGNAYGRMTGQTSQQMYPVDIQGSMQGGAAVYANEGERKKAVKLGLQDKGTGEVYDPKKDDPFPGARY